MTLHELNALLRRKPHLHPTALTPGPARLRAHDPQSIEGNALERVISGEAAGGFIPGQRAKIVFRIYAVRPADWDAYHIKELQDFLVAIGALASDDWRCLQGEVRSGKAHTKADERTEIEIYEAGPTDVWAHAETRCDDL